MLLRYITRQVMAVSMLTASVLLAGIVLIRSSRYLESAVSTQLPAEFIVPVILWRLPEFIAQLLPGAFAVGVAIALARLRGYSELLAASAAGIGLGRMAWLLQGSALIVAALTGLCSLYLAPLGSARSHQILSSPEVIGLVRPPAYGRPLAGGRAIVYAEHSQREGARTALRDVVVLTPHEHNAPPLLVLADSGYIDIDPDSGFQLKLHSGTAYRAEPGGDFTVLRFASFSRSVEDWFDTARRSMRAQARSTPALMADQHNEARAELQRRLALPLLPPALALLSLACAGALRPPRMGWGFQWQSLVVVMVYALSLAALGIWSGATDRPPPTAFWPLPATIAVISTAALLWQSGVLRKRAKR